MASPAFALSLVEAAGLAENGNLDYTAIIRILKAIEARIKPLEGQAGSLADAIEAVRKVGLDRINEVLVPAIQLILAIQSKGFMIAASSTPATMVYGDVLQFTIDDADQRALFTPSPFVGLTRASTPDDYAVLRTVAYTADNGKFIGEVMSFEGAPGPHSDWVLAALAGSTAASVMAMSQALAARADAITAKLQSQAARTAASDYAETAGNQAAIATARAALAEEKANAAAASAATAATFDPSGYYNKEQSYSRGDVDLAVLAEAMAREGAIEAEAAAREAVADALDEHASSSNPHPAAIATPAQARAGEDAERLMTPSLVRAARTLRTVTKSAAYTAVAADFALTLDCSGTWILGLTAAATLGDGWYGYVRNTGTGVITVDPAGAETVDGYSAMKVLPGDVVMLHCDGAAFRSFGRNGFQRITDLVNITGNPSAIDFIEGFDGSFEEIIVRLFGVTYSQSSQVVRLSCKRKSDGIWAEFFTGRLLLFTNSGASGTVVSNSPNIYMPMPFAEIRVAVRAPSPFVRLDAYSESQSLSGYMMAPPMAGLRLQAGNPYTFTGGQYEVLGRKMS